MHRTKPYFFGLLVFLRLWRTPLRCSSRHKPSDVSNRQVFIRPLHPKHPRKLYHHISFCFAEELVFVSRKAEVTNRRRNRNESSACTLFLRHNQLCCVPKMNPKFSCPHARECVPVQKGYIFILARTNYRLDMIEKDYTKCQKSKTEYFLRE